MRTWCRRRSCLRNHRIDDEHRRYLRSGPELSSSWRFYHSVTETMGKGKTMGNLVHRKTNGSGKRSTNRRASRSKKLCRLVRRSCRRSRRRLMSCDPGEIEEDPAYWRQRVADKAVD